MVHRKDCLIVAARGTPRKGVNGTVSGTTTQRFRVLGPSLENALKKRRQAGGKWGRREEERNAIGT